MIEHVKLALSEVDRVLGYGDAKYGVEAWKKPGALWSRHLLAAISHLMRWWGTKRDESGCSHLAHAVARLLIVLELEQNRYGIDDRDGAIAVDNSHGRVTLWTDKEA